ncbi:MAG: hypothetical protein AAGI51_14500 [Pseudomonadota bacterium]
MELGHDALRDQPLYLAQGAGISQRVALRKGAVNFMGVGVGRVVCGAAGAVLGANPYLTGLLAGPIVGGVVAWPRAVRSGSRLQRRLKAEAQEAVASERERQMADAKASGAFDRWDEKEG